ncbi:MAG: hypothetical protein Q8R60_09905 [Mycobacteriales bacterium]|nr:hypothetical protein [Mycobacteriales bacterium]
MSTIRGYWQAPWLRRATQLVLALSLLASVLPGAARDAVAWTAIALVIAAPLLRLTWLLHRWRQEQDHRFVVLGAAVLLVVGTGAALAALGVGS